jgi:hypothetical protein
MYKSNHMKNRKSKTARKSKKNGTRRKSRKGGQGRQALFKFVEIF